MDLKEAKKNLRRQMREHEERCAIANEKDFLELSGWISVKDRLPDENEFVLVASDLSESAYTDYYFCKHDPCWRHTEPTGEKVEYWMPLPEIPRLEEE